MRTSLATVCLSGGLADKLRACADAGFDGVEIMDADLVAAVESPDEIRALCARLGLTIDLFQPFRDFEGVDEVTLADNLRRARAKFEVMRRLGAGMILLCSNVSTATVPDPDVAAEQLGALADVASEYGIKVAYEALAWGRYVNDYREAWRIVSLADRPNLGVCLDSFHILARGDDPAGIDEIDAEKLFFVQLADAPSMELDVLSWSRHHRLFPGEGDFDLTGFLGHVLRMNYRGPISLEVFNDTFRQTDAKRTAAHALRSLRWLFDRTAALNGWSVLQFDPPQIPRAIDFVEITGTDLSPIEQALEQLGCVFGGGHRTKPVQLWRAGETNVILTEQPLAGAASLAGIGFEVTDADAAMRRAIAIGAPVAFRRTRAKETTLPSVTAPDGTGIYWNSQSATNSWLREFEGGQEADAGSLDGLIDHLNIAIPWHEFDETVLFDSSVLALGTGSTSEVPGPRGLVRSHVMRTDDGAVRLVLNVAPPTAPPPPGHVAVRVSDIITVAENARARGLAPLAIPGNYYDDLEARFRIEPEFLKTLRDLHLLYDEDAHGSLIHFYTPIVGDVFFEILERRGSYDGYGAAGAPIRLVAQGTRQRGLPLCERRS